MEWEIGAIKPDGFSKNNEAVHGSFQLWIMNIEGKIPGAGWFKSNTIFPLGKLIWRKKERLVAARTACSCLVPGRYQYKIGYILVGEFNHGFSVKCFYLVAELAEVIKGKIPSIVFPELTINDRLVFYQEGFGSF